MSDSIYSRDQEPDAFYSGPLHFVMQAFNTRLKYLDKAITLARQRDARGIRQESGEQFYAWAMEGQKDSYRANLQAASLLAACLVKYGDITPAELTICQFVHDLVGRLGEEANRKLEHAKKLTPDLPDPQSVIRWLQLSAVEPKYKWSEAWQQAFDRYHSIGKPWSGKLLPIITGPTPPSEIQ